MRNLAKVVVVTSGLSLLSGCYDGAELTLHQAGVYKGGKDPLVALSASAAHKQQLVSRINQVQVDR